MRFSWKLLSAGSAFMLYAAEKGWSTVVIDQFKFSCGEKLWKRVPKLPHNPERGDDYEK